MAALILEKNRIRRNQNEKIFYNPIEHPVAIKLESKVLGVNKQYKPYTGEGSIGMEELFKLAATDSFDIVEVKLTPHNQAYYRDSKNPLEQVPVGYRLRTTRTVVATLRTRLV